MCAISFGNTKHCFLVICWWTFDLIILFSTIGKFMNKHVSHCLTINKHAGGRIICSSQIRAPTDRLKRAFCSVPSWKADEVDENYLLERQWSVFTRTWTGYEWLYHLRKMFLFSSLLIYESSGRCKSVWASLISMSLMDKSLCRYPQVLRVSECKERVINSRICGYKVSHVWGNHILAHLFNQTFYV